MATLWDKYQEMRIRLLSYYTKYESIDIILEQEKLLMKVSEKEEKQQIKMMKHES